VDLDRATTNELCSNWPARLDRSNGYWAQTRPLDALHSIQTAGTFAHGTGLNCLSVSAHIDGVSEIATPLIETWVHQIIAKLRVSSLPFPGHYTKGVGRKYQYNVNMPGNLAHTTTALRKYGIPSALP
jgi:hypothetical protein